MSKSKSIFSLNPADETTFAESDDTPMKPRKPVPVVGFWKIAFAVFVGNILTGLLAAFLYSLR